MPQKRIECFRLLLERLAWIEHQFLSGVRYSRKSWLAKGLGLGFGIICWGSSWRESGQWHFHQDNTPVHNSILVTDNLTKMGIKTVPHPPYSLDLVTFGYSLSSEAVIMRQLRRWKRLWRRSLTRSHKMTSMGLSRNCWNVTTSALQPEEITSKETRVSCVYYQ